MKISPLIRVQLAIKVVGTGAVIAYCVSGGWQQFRDHWFAAVLIFAFETATNVFPFAVQHNGARDEFTPDLMVVAAAALLLPTGVGAVAIPAGFVLGHILRSQPGFSRLDVVPNIVIGNFLAITVAHLIGAPGLGFNSIVGAALSVVIYDVITLLMFAIALVVQGQVKFWAFVRQALATSVIIWPWLMCLGTLLGVVGWDAPWALPLMGAPLALVLMASRSRVEATEDRTRLDGLLKATTDILAATTVASVTTSVASSIASLFESQNGRIDVVGPEKGELSVSLTSEHFKDRHLIVPARASLVRSYTDHDRRLLETLASVTSSALDQAALHEDVTEQATRDALTGLANRRAFEALLQSSVIGKRSTDASGVMFLDLDGFKAINDEYGHEAGDEVLVETARRLLHSVRDGDTVARLGGDEFTVLLRGVHNKDEAVLIAERILASMRKPMRLTSGADVNPTPSLGIALAISPDADPGKLLKEADAAMYEAKRAGKDCWRLAHELIAQT
jgi:diguanylate cyclase (GGDEF)-like protein